MSYTVSQVTLVSEPSCADVPSIDKDAVESDRRHRFMIVRESSRLGRGDAERRADGTVKVEAVAHTRSGFERRRASFVEKDSDRRESIHASTGTSCPI